MAAARQEGQDSSGKLFDYLIDQFQFNLKHDADLARWLGVAPPVVSKIRHGRLTVGCGMIIHIHEKSEMSIADIKSLIAG